MSRILFPEWRKENSSNAYPFTQAATLTNSTQTIVPGILIDAAIYPIGGEARTYLSQVTVAHDTVTLYIGDADNAQRASGQFPTLNPPDNVVLTDIYGRPAGILVSNGLQLSLFAAWGIGTFDFTADQTEFTAAVCFPTPQPGVQGFLLDDGTLLTGDVWIVGDTGVILQPQRILAGSQVLENIILNVVGDPLFRRQLCTALNLFVTPNYIKTITFTDGKQTAVVSPDEFGNISLTVNNALAVDTILRIHPTAEGNKIEAVGSTAGYNSQLPDSAFKNVT